MDRWQERLARVVRGMNASPHEHLMGSAPKDVDGNEVLDFALRKKAALDLQHNDKIIRDREKKLETTGAFRIQEPWSKFERSFKPRFSDKVHQIARIEEGNVVVDTQGKKEAVKLVKPVPVGSTDARPGQFARRGSAQVDAKKRAILEPFARKVVRHIGRGNDMELWRVGEFVKRQRGFNDRAREAGINMKRKIANFLRAFPELFTVITSTEGGEATVTVAD